ncbi:MAG: outer membrane protein assembly factor BamB [Rhodocyclaceae bacterium]|nr:outer membrane protein assembly factor BamB [Rhodocyclaceae bacterium]
MRRIPVLSVVLAAALVLPACSSLNPFADAEPKMAPLPALQASTSLATRWSASIGDAGIYRFEPAVVGEDVFAAAEDGDVARFSGGQARWRVRIDGGLTAGVGADAALAVVANSQGQVIALDAGSGAEQWRATINAEVLAAPSLARDVVVVRSSDNRLFGLDRKSGAVRWTYVRTTPPLTLRNQSGMLVEESVAVTGFPGGKLAAFNLANGGLLWELTVALPSGSTELERIADVVGMPVVYRQNLCAATFQGRVACFDITNGKMIWSRPLSSSDGISRDVRQVYVTEDADAVSALDAFSGASMWRQSALTRRGLSAPLAIAAGVVVGDREGYLHLLNRDTGAFIGRADTDGSAIVVAPKAIGDGVLVQTRGGRVLVLEAR